jgi:hypothetical protein
MKGLQTEFGDVKKIETLNDQLENIEPIVDDS